MTNSACGLLGPATGIVSEIKRGKAKNSLNSECLKSKKMPCISVSNYYGGAITHDNENSLYIAANCRVLKLSLRTNVVEIIAGNRCSQSSKKHKDGYWKDAFFSDVQGIAKIGNSLFISDSGNNQIRRVNIDSKQVTSIAGNFKEGKKDGVKKDAAFHYPTGIATDGQNLYIADSNNSMIRKLDISSGQVTTIAGNGTSGQKDGIGTIAQFESPISLVLLNNILYVADTYGNRIRKVELSSNKVTTLAGQNSHFGNRYKDGTCLEAAFFHPFGIGTDSKNLFILDTGNHVVREIKLASNDVSTIAGNRIMSWKNGVGTDSSFFFPTSIAFQNSKLYILDGSCIQFLQQGNFIRVFDIKTTVITTLPGITE